MIVIRLASVNGVVSSLDARGHDRGAEREVCLSVSLLLRSSLSLLATWPSSSLQVDAQAEVEGRLSWRLLYFDQQLCLWLQGWSGLLLESLTYLQQQRPQQLRLVYLS